VSTNYSFEYKDKERPQGDVVYMLAGRKSALERAVRFMGNSNINAGIEGEPVETPQYPVTVTEQIEAVQPITTTTSQEVAYNYIEKTGQLTKKAEQIRQLAEEARQHAEESGSINVNGDPQPSAQPDTAVIRTPSRPQNPTDTLGQLAEQEVYGSV